MAERVPDYARPTAIRVRTRLQNLFPTIYDAGSTTTRQTPRPERRGQDKQTGWWCRRSRWSGTGFANESAPSTLWAGSGREQLLQTRAHPGLAARGASFCWCREFSPSVHGTRRVSKMNPPAETQERGRSRPRPIAFKVRTRWQNLFPTTRGPQRSGCALVAARPIFNSLSSDVVTDF